jgi:hypothetical protein
MKVRRKFSLNRIGKAYESVDIEVNADTIEEAMGKIEDAWRTYCKAVVDGKVQ